VSTAERLRELIEKATPPVEWGLAKTSSGGAIVTRRPDAPMVSRHIQSHLQIVPAEDAHLIVVLVRCAEQIAAVLEDYQHHDDNALWMSVSALDRALAKEMEK